MGKVMALLIGGAGAAAVSVGGAYLLKGKASSQQSDSATEENTKKVEFDDLSKFKKAKGGRCAIDLFKEIENIESKEASVEFTSSNLQNTEFFGTASTDANKTKGCLIINWERSENSDKNK